MATLALSSSNRAPSRSDSASSLAMSAYYEYRAYDGETFLGIYRVDRQALVSALKAFGVDLPPN